MRFLSRLSLLIASTLMALAVTAVPAPVPVPVPEPAPVPEIDLSNVTVLATGRVTGFLSKRSIPSECRFQGIRSSYAWVQLKLGGGHKACYGWDEWVCGRSGAGSSSPWPERDVFEMSEAVAQQFAKDGQFKTSTVGGWIANFALGTTAMTDRAANVYFVWAQQVCGYGIDRPHQAYFFSYDFNFLTVSPTKHFC